MIHLLPLLAFDFASPWLLWGLVLGGIPLVIHLLHKRQYEEMPWAAMQFLLEATRKNSRRIRLEQLLLLLVRTLIIVLVVLALAQPYMEAFGTYFQAEAPTHRVILMDASFSMGFQEAELTRFDRAKQMAQKIVAAANQGDALNLVRISGSSPRAIVRQPAYQKSQVDAEIEQLGLSEEPGEVVPALAEVAEILRDVPDIDRKEVYVISDFQRSSWMPGSAGEKAQIRRLLKQIGEKAGLNLLDVGELHSPNAAVTQFEMREPLAPAGQPLHLQVTSENFGDERLAGKLLELYSGDRLLETRTIDLPAGGQARAEFVRTFQESGEHKLEVRLENDPLEIDNRRRLILPVRDGLNVLLVNGKHSGAPAAGATDHLRLALSPSPEESPRQGFLRPHTIDDGELEGTDLGRFDCIFLCNVRLFTAREADLLKAYAEAGGAVVFTLGDQVQADNYNQMLYRDGEGVLPAQLGVSVSASDAGEEFLTFNPLDFGHPIVSAFRGNPDAGLETTPIAVYVRAGVPKNRVARVALEYSTGDPAIVEGPVGHGRCILITTALDKQWGTWVVWPSFPPMMHELVYFAVSGRWGERQLNVGDPLTRVFSSGPLNGPLTVTLPGGEEKALALTEMGHTSGFSYEATEKSGFYEITFGPPSGRREVFAVNVDPGESDLSKATENELRAELLAQADVVYRTGHQSGAGPIGRQEFRDPTDVAVSDRGGMTRWLLFAALCLIFVEQLMAWRFFYGFLMLYGVVSFGFVRQAWAWDAVYGVLLLLVLATGFALLVHAGHLAAGPARRDTARKRAG